MALKLLTLKSLKLVQLKSIAVSCGINSSGTKALLTSRMLEELQISRLPEALGPSRETPKTKDDGLRILSIDMGIRNLAYCVLQLPSGSERNIITDNSPVAVIAWKRISISHKHAKIPSSTATKAKKSNSSPEAPEPSHGKEMFEPGLFANYAYKLFKDNLLLYHPTHILIERQRYRSMGSAAIQEWTIRVNMFEAMLYAVLHTLREERVWAGSFYGVSPAKVGPFWVNENRTDKKCVKSETRKSKTKATKLKNKGAKIDQVGEWLDDGKIRVKLSSDEAQSTAVAFLKKWKYKGHRAEKRLSPPASQNEQPLDKLDDLADCLLQGMAWIRWEHNRLLILKEGPNALGKLKSPL
ncbi:MAG: hypothetical protein M1829_006758 [Trizodia sp. TS-e1964]|nr:MAG: hypothetical protein M1829_006758 [Trizodia sp. TS-e1964]